MISREMGGKTHEMSIAITTEKEIIVLTVLRQGMGVFGGASGTIFEGMVADLAERSVSWKSTGQRSLDDFKPNSPTLVQ